MDVWGWRWLEQLRRTRFAVRTLRKSPGFTATVVLTRADHRRHASIFGPRQRCAPAPLPFPDPDRLVQIYGRTFASDVGRPEPDPVTGR